MRRLSEMLAGSIAFQLADFVFGDCVTFPDLCGLPPALQKRAP